MLESIYKSSEVSCGHPSEYGAYAAPFPPLERVTKPTLTTAEIAYYTNQTQNTWRIHACHETYPEGLRPIRIGRRLNWPTCGLKKLLEVKK